MDTIAGAMSGMPRNIVNRQIAYFLKADPAYGQGVVEPLGALTARSVFRRSGRWLPGGGRR